MAILITILVVWVSVLVHEGGHFLIGKKLNYAIDEFSIGFGRKIWQKKKNNITYSLRSLPLGGYVAFPKEKVKGKRFMNEPSWSKFIVLIMGVVCNLLLAGICFSIISMIAGNGIGKSFIYGFNSIGDVIAIFISQAKELLNINSYGSVVQLATTTDSVISDSASFVDVIQKVLAITGILNITLALFNLLPFPILDGGQIVINAIELLIRKSLPEKLKTAMMATCWVLIMGFGCFLLLRDVINL